MTRISEPVILVPSTSLCTNTEAVRGTAPWAFRGGKWSEERLPRLSAVVSAGSGSIWGAATCGRRRLRRNGTRGPGAGMVWLVERGCWLDPDKRTSPDGTTRQLPHGVQSSGDLHAVASPRDFGSGLCHGSATPPSGS